MLVHVLREYNINRIFLSCLGCWPFQSKLAKRFLPMFCFALEISYLPFEVIHVAQFARLNSSELHRRKLACRFPFSRVKWHTWDYEYYLSADINLVRTSKRRTDGLRVLLSDGHNFRFSRQVTESALEPRQGWSRFKRVTSLYFTLIQVRCVFSYARTHTFYRLLASRRDQFRRLYEIMEDHWNTFTSDMEARVLKDYSTISHKFTVYYASEYAY